jgi:MOSC domain-containing protein YiiM
VQIDGFSKGLLKEVVGKGPDGELIRRAGVMSVVRAGGVVRPGDEIRVELPPEPHRPLEKV